MKEADLVKFEDVSHLYSQDDLAYGLPYSIEIYLPSGRWIFSHNAGQAEPYSIIQKPIVGDDKRLKKWWVRRYDTKQAAQEEWKEIVYAGRAKQVLSIVTFVEEKREENRKENEQ